MREDGASAEASPRVFLNEAGGILRGIAFPWGVLRNYGNGP